MINTVLLVLYCTLSTLSIPSAQNAVWMTTLDDEVAYQQRSGPRVEETPDGKETWCLKKTPDDNYLFTWGAGGSSFWKYCPKWLFSGVVRTKVIDVRGEKLRYTYSITNDETSQQNIRLYSVACPDQKNVVSIRIEGKEGDLLPWNVWHRYIWSWFCGNTSVGIEKGTTFSNIVLESNGLPVISTAYLEGNRNDDQSETNSAEDVPEGVARFRTNMLNESKTVSVVAPGNVTPDLPTIRGWLADTKKLGWITQSAADSITAKLAQVESSGNSPDMIKETLNDLDVFLKDNQILEEAWALFHYNLDWMRQHPPVTKSHSGPCLPWPNTRSMGRPLPPIPLRPE